MSSVSCLSIVKLLSLCVKLMINYSFYKRTATLLIVYENKALRKSIRRYTISKTLSILLKALISILLKTFGVL
jgi:hypothetical protein